MNKRSLAREINNLILLVALGALAAIAFNSAWPIVMALAAYLYWHLRQLFNLYEWLMRADHQEPPDGTGLWGDLYTRLEHLFQKEKRAQNNLSGIIQRAQESVNALEDGVILINAQGRLEYSNQAAQYLIGIRIPHDYNQTLTNLMRDPSLIKYLQEGKFRDPLELSSPRDDNLILQFRITEFGQGDRLILARDVTRLHHLEQMRKDFVANVSHELKTPLTVLKGYLETLSGSIPEEQKRVHRALSQMSQQSSRMEALVHDLLLLSRLENTEADKTQSAVMLAPMLRRMLEDARALSGESNHHFTISVDENAKLIANPAELESAFGNLLTNAVKYTPAEGNIHIEFSQNYQGGSLSVIDDGLGIDPQHIPRLTERFYRPDNSRHLQTGGTGLGLAIVKHVMIRHQGSLVIKSELGKGSTFTCKFPNERLVSQPTALAENQ